MFFLIMALLTAAIVVWAIISFGALLDLIEEVKEEYGTSTAVGDVNDLIDKMITEQLTEKQKVSLEDLRKKAGKAGVYTAAVKDGVVIKNSLKLVSSDEQDEETQELLQANDGLVYVA